MSRLEQMQANWHRQLLREKEEKVRMANDHRDAEATSDGAAGLDLSASQNGGNVRRFFEGRRTTNLDGSVNLDSSLASLDSYFLNASNGLIARNSVNAAAQRPKKGSPLGWDKSFPLAPIERANSGSSSGYESVGGSMRRPAESGRRVPHVRRPSLDRNRTTAADATDVASMRRSKSQIFEGSTSREEAAARRTAAARKGATLPSKERRFSRDEEKRKLQQDMRRREQELISKIKEQQAEIERMRLEKIKEEKAQKARLYRKPAPISRHPPTQEKKAATTTAQPPASPPSASRDEETDAKPTSRPTSAAASRDRALIPAKKYQPPRPPVAANKPAAQQKPPVRRSSANSDLPECPDCGRRFAFDRIEKHVAICKKVSTKKRKTFDPVKMRTEGTEQESYLRKGKPVARAEAKKSNWRQKHDSFLQAIRQAKLMQEHVAAGGKLSDLPPPPPMDTSDYVQCPHCTRRFSEAAAERHIPKCQKIRSNKK